MKIEIDSQDLLNILLDANIEEVNAKALILDILMIQEGKPVNTIGVNNPLPTVRKPVPHHAMATRPAVVEEPEEETEEEHVRRKVTKVAENRKMDFRAFGGDATGLIK